MTTTAFDDQSILHPDDVTTAQASSARWDAEARAIGMDKASGVTRWNPLPSGGMNPHPCGLYVRFEDVSQDYAQDIRNAALEEAAKLVETANGTITVVDTREKHVPQEPILRM